MNTLFTVVVDGAVLMSGEFDFVNKLAQVERLEERKVLVRRATTQEATDYAYWDGYYEHMSQFEPDPYEDPSLVMQRRQRATA